MSRGKKLDLFIGASFDEDRSPVEERSNQTQKLLKPQEHKLVFKREKRRGKVVTLVGEFFLEKKEAQKLLKRLKASLACGGSFKEGWMEFQGEVQERLKPLLLDANYRFKH